MDKFWVMLLLPFYLLIVLTVFGIPITWLVKKLPENSRIRKILLTRW